MVGGDYRTSAQKAGKSAGQRARREARRDERQLRDANLYRISVCDKPIKKGRHDNAAVYGVYKNEDGDWVLTAMSAQRSRTRYLSDRQGATKSEVVDSWYVYPHGGELRPENGLVLGTYDTKKEALRNSGASSSSRIESGRYVVYPEDCRYWTTKVDRNKYHDFQRSGNTVSL